MYVVLKNFINCTPNSKTNFYMKKTLFLFMTLFISVINAQEIAKVSKVNGVEVYILAEPIREYEVVMGGKNSIKWSSFATGGLVNDGISSKISQFVKALQEKAQKENVTFDAVIYTNGKSVNAIKGISKNSMF